MKIDRVMAPKVPNLIPLLSGGEKCYYTKGHSDYEKNYAVSKGTSR